MTDRMLEIVDQIGSLDMRIKSTKAALAELMDEREALVQTLEGMVARRPRLTVDGRRWRATVLTRTRVAFPTKSADPMNCEKLKGNLREAGLWDLVSDVSFPRLKSLWFHPERAPEAFRRVATPFARESSTVTVRCSPLGNAVQARNA